MLDYAQKKNCVVSFTKNLSQQLAEKGIRVNAVSPGPFWTPLQSSGGQPVELAPIYVLLASHESSYATGQVYGASGGGGNP